jgi:hypothetical protein
MHRRMTCQVISEERRQKDTKTRSLLKNKACRLWPLRPSAPVKLISLQPYEAASRFGAPSTSTLQTQRQWRGRGEMMDQLEEVTRSRPPLQSSPTVQLEDNPMSLLFIVRSGSSTNKTEEDRRQINRRAQQNAYLKRQQARQRRSRSQIQNASSQSLEVASREPKLSSRKQSQQDGGLAEENDHPWVEQVSLTHTIGPSNDALAPSIRSYLNSRRLDPFSSGMVPMTPQMESIFMHYATVLLPVIEPIQAEREEFHRWLVPLTVNEPALLYSLTACFAYDIELGSVYGFGPTSRKNMTSERVGYRLMAIQALNQCLGDPEQATKPSTLLAVHYLLWHEVSLSPLHIGFPLRADTSQDFCRRRMRPSRRRATPAGTPRRLPWRAAQSY